ncbi:5'/3'-nucleotidase SurE [Halobaculum sp. MBLA0147]|uniref:5'/3'-nucleotidase SurE n=1 Tax=Halobaculum sp. MBLA0147 TaxID=3079934 RepID=UPI003524679D
MSPDVLLTNDDGVDAPGLRVVAEALAPVASLTVLAPASDQSGAGRTYNRAVTVREHDPAPALARVVDDCWAVAGTPVDCVNVARGRVQTDFDAVVAGCNDGPNLGAHKLGQSGTVGAARQAAFFGVPGVAVSVYDPPTGVRAFDAADYRAAGRVAREVVVRLPDDGFPPGVDHLNCNVPAAPSASAVADPTGWRVTEPLHDADVTMVPDDDGHGGAAGSDESGENPDDTRVAGDYRLFDHFYDPLIPDNGVDADDPPTTDRGAIARECVSVSPLSVDGAAGDTAAVREWLGGG